MRGQANDRHGVEVFLDNRQVFLLFFASAVILSLVFTLGVVVGKRADRQPVPVEGADPLALLDQMGGAGEDREDDEALTFHEALGTPGEAGEAGEAGEPSQGGQAADAAPEAERVAQSGRAGSPRSRGNKVRGEEARGEEARGEEARGEEARSEARRESTRSKARAARGESTRSKARAARGGDKQRDAAVGRRTGTRRGSMEEDTRPRPGSYTLQLSAFQDRHEARLFMEKLRGAGLEPYMVATTIPGRGVWFRVRLGRYSTWDEALTAKQRFERAQKIIAYVAKN